ncbi:hypothetical protein BV898_12250 [Hypsibius exemplaris]|uniref:G-protein coupled receptors family 1 profile domain-containing protein n=1 Tax=Hypsibius exemplaris TaxID=2072580 RepID=A0A1W0WEF0_HYPEX|nr:hypothetical protein BV898_12250 [Hypsibius exemplaris]
MANLSLILSGNDSFGFSTNKTFLQTTLARGLNWTFLPVFSLTILILALLTNGTVLSLFLRNRSLCTAFNIYLINLLIANVLNMLTQVPVFLLNALAGDTWWTGHMTCNLYLYGFIFQAIMSNSHVLITVNRLWAVLMPLSYRRHHTRGTAFFLCAFMWIWVHAFKMAYLIRDALYFRPPEGQFGCNYNRPAQQGMALVNQYLIFNVPLASMILAYPVICYRQWKRSRRAIVAPQEMQQMRTANTAVTSQHEKTLENPATGTVAGRSMRPTKKPKRKSQAFLVLTCVTISMVVAWLPSIVYYTIILHRKVNWPGFQQAATVLWYVESVIDPVLFTCAVTDLRNEFRRLIRI